MSIAISEEHRALAQTVAGLLTKHQSRAAARSLLVIADRLAQPIERWRPFRPPLALRPWYPRSASWRASSS